MTSSKCHIVSIIVRFRGVGGGRLSEQKIENHYPKNVSSTGATNALDDACNALDFLNRGNGGVCIPSGRGKDVTRFLRDECQGKFRMLKRYL
ncbi:hypothetical protein [Halobaculum sp. MBLA0143]|uniref:hypothetical protein n=1 Tax=Halobaculum sp. MBLA0143 TaxID=3079933 RepID=UPI0035263F5D